MLAVKAARDHMATHKGIRHPEMLVGPSAHAAYWKAAEYFNIKLVQAPLGPDYRFVVLFRGRFVWQLVFFIQDSSTKKTHII